MRFASLGSGSLGNSLIVEAGCTRVMLDCGFSVRETESRLARAGLDPDSLSALIVTHEHDDHSAGVFSFARRHRVPVWLSHGTLAALRRADPNIEAGVGISITRAGQAFGVGDLLVLPYTVPHDAREPVQFVFSDGTRRLGVLTDAGCSTAHIKDVLSGCDALVIEANHDLEMLKNGSYPAALKARIAGRLGHLDNTASAEILAEAHRGRLEHVVAAHLSRHNNKPEYARVALAATLCCEPEWIGVASQESGFGWRSMG
jgi:phosphoribosyl 1,2-cyclic phosphodiesterase